MKKTAYLLSVGRLWWMAQVFRPLTKSGSCFDPGLGRLLRFESLRLWHLIYDRERWLWWKLRLRGLGTSGKPAPTAQMSVAKDHTLTAQMSVAKDHTLTAQMSVAKDHTL